MGSFLVERIFLIVPLILSLTVHEWAHAWSAFRLGDDTAARMGRLTLNPIPHIDPVGTLLLPLMGVPFGWARPVPVQPVRFRRDVPMARGMMITAAAGPISNLVLAVVSAALVGGFERFAPGFLYANGGVATFLGTMVWLNIVLALFNLIPVPPLDGSRIVDGLMPYRLRPRWEAVARLGPVLLIGVLFFGGRLILGPAHALQDGLYRLVGLLVG